MKKSISTEFTASNIAKVMGLLAETPVKLEVLSKSMLVKKRNQSLGEGERSFAERLAHLVEFYKRLNWKPFEGQVFVEQPQGKVEFSANGAMVLDVREQASTQGILDLNGLPW